jgi:hypothetical protein
MAESIFQQKPMHFRGWASARTAIIAAVSRGNGIITLVGPAGVGKTVLLRDLEQHLRTDHPTVQRVDNGQLVTGAEAGAVLLIDEAGGIDLAALLNLTSRSDQFAVLAILPGFVSRFEALPHQSIKLVRLGTDEVPHYIAARIEACGIPAERFSAEALTAIAVASTGLPRLLNVLIGNSLLEADLAGAPNVTPEHVAAAAAMHAPSVAETQPAASAKNGSMPNADQATSMTLDTPDVLIGSSLLEADLAGAPNVTPEHVAAAAAMHAPSVAKLPPAASAKNGSMANADGAPSLMLNTPDVLIGSSLLEADLAGAPNVTPEHVAAAATVHAPRVAEPPPTALAPPATSPKAESMPNADGAPSMVLDTVVEVDRPRVRRRYLGSAFIGLAAVAGLALLLAQNNKHRPAVPVEMAPAAPRNTANQPANVPTVVADSISQVAPPAPALQEAPRDQDQGLFPNSPARIVLTYPRGDETAAARGSSLATVFRQAGVRVSAPFPVVRTSAEDVLSYFFAEDRSSAQAVALLAGGEPAMARLGSLPPGAPLPRPRTIELALAGSRGLTASPAPQSDTGRTNTESLPPLPAVAQMVPTDGAEIVATRAPIDVVLTWVLPVAPTLQCCFCRSRHATSCRLEPSGIRLARGVFRLL